MVLRSVRSRMVAAMVVVVTVAVVATAWLATRAAEDAVRSSANQSLENDAAIYQALVDHGVQHSSWDGVNSLLADLSERYDRRVAITDARGRLIADSDRADGGSSRALPDRPTAQLDPWNPSLGLFGVSLVTVEPQIDAIAIDAAVACLDTAAIPFELVETNGQLLPQPAATADESEFAAFVRCTDPMYGSLEPFGDAPTERADVAPAVLLYLGTRAEVNPLSGPSAWRTAGLAAFVALVAAVGGWWLSRRTTRPFLVLADAAARLEAGDMSARVPGEGPVEAQRVSRAFNSMAASLQRTESQRRQMVADIAHELRNPLVTLNGTLEAIEDGVYAPTPDVIASLADDTAHLTRLVSDLQQLAHADAGGLQLELSECDLAALAATVIDAHRSVAAAASVGLSLEVEAHSVVVADTARLRQVLDNLLSNAIRHTPHDGEVTVVVRADGFDVRDTGEGIAPDDQPMVFDRFWRADPSRTRATGGTGLGLAIVKAMVTAHGGVIDVSSMLGEGTVFTVRGLVQPSGSDRMVTPVNVPPGS